MAPASNRFNTLPSPNVMARFIALPPNAPIANIINPMTYGTCDTIALMLRKGLRYNRGRIWNGYVLQAGLQNGPNTIRVSTSFHKFKATPKAE